MTCPGHVLQADEHVAVLRARMYHRQHLAGGRHGLRLVDGAGHSFGAGGEGGGGEGGGGGQGAGGSGLEMVASIVNDWLEGARRLNEQAASEEDGDNLGGDKQADDDDLAFYF